MSYATKHASALTKVTRRGTSVTFTLTTPGAQHADGTFTAPTSASVAGVATEEGGDPKEYERLKLTESEAPRLFFIASTYGQIPALGASCTWGGETYTVRSVKPYRPDGTSLCAYVIVAR